MNTLLVPQETHLKSILAPLDGSASAETGLRWAEHVASCSGAAIRLVRVVEGEMADALARTQAVKAEDYLESHAGLLRDRGVQSGFHVASGPATERILAMAEEADLVVMTYGTSRWLFGGVLDGVLQGITRPIVVVRATPGIEAELPPARRILVPVDTAAYSSGILPAAVGIAKSLGATLILGHTIAPLGEYRDPGAAPPGVRRMMEALIEEAHRFLAGVAEQVAASGVSTETAVSIGDAAREIVRTAESAGTGLIAMATRGRDRLERRLMGSVSNAVVQSTSIPCLLVRPQSD